MSLFGIALPGGLDSDATDSFLDPASSAVDAMHADQAIIDLQDLIQFQMDGNLPAGETQQSSSATGPNKKRQRLETVTLACQTCRSQHLKCDGQQPLCSRCGKKGIECIWDSKRRKRGPPKRKIASDENESFANDLELFQLPPANVPDSSLHRLQSLGRTAASTSLIQNHQLANKFLLLDFVNTYQEHMFPILLVDPPILDPAEIVQLPWNTSMNDGHKMCMFAILASGARGVGNIEYATELQNRARALLGDNFDQQTPHLAATQYLFANLFADSGEPQKALFYNRTARSTLETLIMQHGGAEVVDGVHLPYLYLVTVVSEVDYITNADGFGFMDYVQAQLQHLAPRREIYRLLQCFLNIFTTWIESANSIHTISEVDKIVLNMTAHLENIPMSFRLRPSVKNRLERLIKAVASVMYFHAHKIDKALKLADEVVEYVKLLGPAYHDVWSICDLFQIAQIHLRIDEAKFREDVELLALMAPVHPLAQRACRRLDRLRQQWELVKESPGALVLTPFAVSSTVEIANETDQMLLSWSPHQLPISTSDARNGNSSIFPVYKEPYLHLAGIYKNPNRIEEVPDIISSSPSPSSQSAVSSSVSLLDFMSTHGHAAEIEASTLTSFPSDADFLASIDHNLFAPE